MLRFCPLLALLTCSQAHNSSNVNVASKTLEYFDGPDRLVGFVAWEKNTTDRPIVLVVHNWDGRDEFENSKAIALAKIGYVGFAVDIYGNGTHGTTHDENMHLMKPYTDDRNKLLSRLRAAISATNSLMDGNSRLGSTSIIGAIGYCFGGTAVLDMARSGMPVKSVVSFHGTVAPFPNSTFSGNITAEIMVHNGYKDPFVSKDRIDAFQREMDDRNADWVFTQHGTAYHSFTDPHANWPGKAVYDKNADKRSWQAMKGIFKETLHQ